MRRVAVALGLKSPVPEDLTNVPKDFLRDVKRMNKAPATEICQRLGLSTEGKVPELRQRILHHYATSSGQISEADTGRLAKRPSASQDATSGTKPGPKKRKWRRTDPAEIAPHYYHKDLFAANFPLVEMVEVPKGYPFPVADKFEGVVLDEKVTYEARRKWIRRFFNVSQTFKTPENERQAFPVHFSFLEPLKKLTRPSREEVSNHNRRKCIKRKLKYEDVQQVGRAKKRARQDTEDFAGLYFVPGQEEAPEQVGSSGSGGNYSGLELSTEDAAKLQGDMQEDDDIPTGFADGVVHIFDEKPDKTNPDRVAAVLERKFIEDSLKWNARFQGGFYSAKYALENLQRGHGSAIYILVMTLTTWSYGILVPEGCVDIRNGIINTKSMVQFERHQAITGVHLNDYKGLVEKLEAGTEFYQRNFKDNPTALYRDGPMLVGRLYLCSEWFDLPRNVDGGGLSEGGHRLFDGLLRLVIGDSVLDLTRDELDERMKLRREMVDEQVDAWFAKG